MMTTTAMHCKSLSFFSHPKHSYIPFTSGGSLCTTMDVAKGGQTECPICMEELTSECEKRTCERPCTYTFHTHCFDQWIVTTRRGCPVCRGRGAAQDREEMQKIADGIVFSFMNAMAEWTADNISGAHGFRVADAYRRHLDSHEQ